MGGRARRLTPTREAQRFHWAILQLERKGMNGSELARRTGIHQTHINAFKHIVATGRTGIGSEIVRKMRDGLGLDPSYFFDDYQGERPVELYLFSRQKQLREAAEAQKQLAEMSAAVELMKQRVEQLERSAKPAPSVRRSW